MKKLIIIIVILFSLIVNATAKHRHHKRIVKPAITAFYVIGNSYSSTNATSFPSIWPGILSSYLGFPFVQANNAAEGGAKLDTNQITGTLGLLEQLEEFPYGYRPSAWLVIWIFPDESDFAADPEHVTDVYTKGIDWAYNLGFRNVLMPNAPDITKTQ